MSSTSIDPVTSKPAGRIQQAQGVRLLPLLQHSIRSAGFLLAVWVVGYKHWSVTWVLLSSLLVVAVSEFRSKRLKTRAAAAAAAAAAADGGEESLARVDELPSWVCFPDVDRAEWLNKMIQQMWPFIGTYISKLLRNVVEPIINDALPKLLTPFTFDTIDLGSVPPRVGGVKVYTDNVQRNEIIIDMEIVYASDADLKVSHRGFHAGVKDLQVSGIVRVVLKPLVNKIPIIGGLSVCFIHQPKIDFDLTDVANLFDLPLLSTALRTVVGDILADILVLPNKISVSLMDEQSLHEALFVQPKGILQLCVKEAADLKGADFAIHNPTSDPYCKITVGRSQTKETRVIEKTVSPVWNEAFEFIVRDGNEQILLEVFDKDAHGTDDKLGRKLVDLASVITSSTVDNWCPLDDISTGRIHIIARWLYLNNDPASLSQAMLDSHVRDHMSAAILLVIVDSAKNLPRAKRQVLDKLAHKSSDEPSPCVVLQVGNTRQKTSVKESSTNPKWEEKFEFLFADPNVQELSVEVVDCSSKAGKPLGTRKVPLKDILACDDMTISYQYSLRDSGQDAKLTLHLRLCMLTAEVPISQQDSENVNNTSRSEKDPDTVSVTESIDMLPTTDHTHAAAAAAAAAGAAAALPTSRAGEFVAGDEPLPGLLPVDDVIISSKSTLLNSKTSANTAAATELRQRTRTVPCSEGKFGTIQLTVRYSAPKSQLIVVVHQCRNLIPCDTSDNLADPYVRLFLLPDHSTIAKRKTEVVKNNLNPVFDQSFEWPASRADVVKRVLEVSVKNHVGFSLKKERVNMGQLHLNLATFDDIITATTDWYQLSDPDIQL